MSIISDPPSKPSRTKYAYTFWFDQPISFTPIEKYIIRQYSRMPDGELVEDVAPYAIDKDTYYFTVTANEGEDLMVIVHPISVGGVVGKGVSYSFKATGKFEPTPVSNLRMQRLVKDIELNVLSSKPNPYRAELVHQGKRIVGSIVGPGVDDTGGRYMEVMVGPEETHRIYPGMENKYQLKLDGYGNVQEFLDKNVKS